ncbi:nucleotidyltransferase family protein [Spirosoma radiotolerans]|uniref:4-diphosphocytidyl-2C-methyl-D-erythritol synthase n=1 Tax=Spirosoma radiotolerans TaxID=1379870 RepID=A0A0E3VAI1_9BACT|nr:nucleotidyltransferase family protein [Spirosoma radiotolerans]AKD58116.1 4-diphosphocytidyl-2C-methyl-D-erythritol synthase [Spirosoma radiotolerans]
MIIATIILAAGGSTRLGGEPKQLLTQNGKTLVRQITEAALSLEAGPVVVVLGGNEERIRAELTGLPIRTPINPNWQQGLASSIQVGLNQLNDEPVDAFLMVLTDQPYVTAQLLQQLITTQHQMGRGIVACRYGESGHLGVPALFDIRYRSEFMLLSGDTGARKLIQQYVNDCSQVLFPQAAIDLDTWQDVDAWRGIEGKTESA